MTCEEIKLSEPKTTFASPKETKSYHSPKYQM